MDNHNNTWDIPSNCTVYPNEIIEFLDLKQPIYYEASQWGEAMVMVLIGINNHGR